MLLRFGAANYLSFFSRQEISLIATSLNGNSACLVQVPKSTIQVLPVALVYGPNASGKSNLIAAFRFMVAAINHSHRTAKPDEKVPRKPFALDELGNVTPSTFDVDFLLDGVRYHYGFSCTDEAFIEEWLYSYPTGTKRTIFERTAPDEVKFGPSMRGQKAFLKSAMRNNSLFLSAAAQNNHPELGHIAQHLTRVEFYGGVSVAAHKVIAEYSKKDVDPRAIKILKQMGTGVVGMSKERITLSDQDIQARRSLIDTLTNIFGEPSGEVSDISEEVVVRLIHLGNNGQEVAFDLERESTGTRRLLVILSSVFNALDNGKCLVIDELDASLHTGAAEILISLFKDPEINKSGAQIVATTHDTNLMSSLGLRRDEVWFVEKSDTGASEIHSLSDYAVRSTDNIERAYQQGRFGAVPFTGPAADWLVTHNVAEYTKPKEEPR